LRKVRTIQLESHEHDTGKDHDAQIDLPDELVFFTPCPTERRVEAMEVLPVSCELLLRC
jgi:hypothetical protein